MNIAYNGSFLLEGLINCGHNVLKIPEEKDEDINGKLKKLNRPVDMVILELFGNNISIECLAECDYPLVAHCIDTPINEFWLKNSCRLFDHVFVDQRSSVNTLKQININSSVLPLCCPSSYFIKNNRDKIYDISFIGTLNDLRIKRKNIIWLLQKYFKINIINNISILAAQSIFSRSKVVLNENFFAGINLRVIQGLAANSLVYTEETSIVDDCLRDGEQFVCYRPDNLIHKLNDIISSYSKYQNIVENGNHIARDKFSSEAQTKDLFLKISENIAVNPRLSLQERQWHELKAKYLSTLRFGGTLNRVLKSFIEFSLHDSPFRAESLLELGNIFTYLGDFTTSEQYYKKSLYIEETLYGWLKLSLLYLASGNIIKAKSAMSKLEKFIPSNSFNIHSFEIKNETSELLFIIAQILFLNGKIFDMGFSKSFLEPVPDTAFYVAKFAYEKSFSPAILDFMINCLQPYGLSGELLHLMLAAIKNGRLSNRQIIQTAEIASQYYDLETANTIISSLKSTL